MRTLDPVTRFHTRYAVTDDGCWVWTGCLSEGYGRHTVGGRNIYAHRYSYELRHGPIEDGLQVDHVCRNRACVNPDHLEAVTQRENILRGDSGSAENARKQACKNGHPFDTRNTRIRPDGRRDCRACARERMRQSRVVG